MNSCGIESYWDYDSYSAGRAGTASINLFSGNLVWTHQGLSFDGARMPVAVNLSFGNTYGSHDGTSYWRRI